MLNFMISYFATLERLEKKYQFTGDMELQFRGDLLVQNFDVFMKNENLSWDRDAGACN